MERVYLLAESRQENAKKFNRLLKDIDRNGNVITKTTASLSIGCGFCKKMLAYFVTYAYDCKGKEC